MHTDVELDESPSRQHVLEDESSRRSAMKIFQCSHATVYFLLSTIRLTRSYKDEPVTFSTIALAVQVVHHQQHPLVAAQRLQQARTTNLLHMHVDNTSSTPLRVYKGYTKRRWFARESRARCCKPHCSFSTRETARM